MGHFENGPFWKWAILKMAITIITQHDAQKSKKYFFKTDNLKKMTKL